jgi:hypothetical protein
VAGGAPQWLRAAAAEQQQPAGSCCLQRRAGRQQHAGPRAGPRAITPTQSAGSQRRNETLIPEPGALHFLGAGYRTLQGGTSPPPPHCATVASADMLIYGAVRKPSCTADRHDSAQCTVRVASTCSHASHGVRQYQPSTCTHCMYRPYNRLLTCTAYYSTWYHAACAAHKDQQPRRTHVLDLVQNRLRARPRTYVAASSLCARPRSSNNSLCARPRSCKLFVRPTSMHRPACTQMVGSRSRLRASDRSSKLLARASKSFGQPTVHTRPIRTPQTAPTASNPIRSELCFKGGLVSFDRLAKRFAAI